MSENRLAGHSQTSEEPKLSVRPDIKSVLQYPFNGLTSSQNSSRGTSPSPQVSSIPTSQLPPSRIIPISQLPPDSSINAASKKISQLSVQNESVIMPQFTSTPNEAIQLPNKNINIGAGDFSPITSKIENNAGLVLQNFQDIPLNEEKTVSNINNSTKKFSRNTQMKSESHNVIQQQETIKTSNTNVFENRVPHVQPTNSNNQLYRNDHPRNFNITSTTMPSQKILHTQSIAKNIDTQQNGRDYLPSQNQIQQPVFHPVSAMNLTSQHFQNIESTNYNKVQPKPPACSNKAPNIQSGPFSGNPTSKLKPVTNLSPNLNNATFPLRPLEQLNTPPDVNRMQSNFGQAMTPSHRTATSFSLQTHQIPVMGSNQNASPMTATLDRPKFNLNAMTSQSQSNFMSVSQPMGIFSSMSQPLANLTATNQSTVSLSSMSQPQGILAPMDHSGGMKISSQIFEANQPSLPIGVQPLSKTSVFPPTTVMQQNRIPPVNQAVPILAQDYSKGDAKTATLHSNRYPTLPPQRVTNRPNFQPSYGVQTQPIQNQQYEMTPSVGYKQSNFNQYQNVVSQGFNKLWGSETYDLLQTSNILPPDKIEPPQVMLGNETLNSANCSGQIFRSTITKIPESQSLLQKSRLPLGILIHPFKDLTQLSVIQCNVIVRCRACRTYINPYVFFVDSKRWKCNLCYRINDLPEEFQYDPVSKTYGDPSRRPEIKASTIEYIAPAEYMLRPPQPAVYLFLLDVSRLAIECGYLNIFCSVLLNELVNLPGDSRTQVGFITYDSSLHFFSFAEGLSQPHEMMVLDIDDIFLPCPDNLLVNLKDRMELIKDLLQQLPTRYNNSFDGNSALGSALQAAHRMMSATGGRVTVFQASLPNIGPGALTAREDPNQRASAEVQNLKPANDFYKRLALDCSSQQIAVDLFIVNSQYVDIATISGISRFSGGCIHHFPLFKFGRPILTEKLEKCFRRYITRKIGFEAVMRIRCTRGMSIHTFHGNFFVRSTDLLSLPNVNPDAGYGMQVSIDENLSDVETVCFQAALLYTSSKGERRIRVHTLCLPVVSTLHDVINSADQQCIIGLLAKMAVDRSTESSLSDAREAFINVVIDILSSYKLSLNLGSAPGGLLAPNCLKLLPLYISALLKNQAFRTGTSTRLDDRMKAMINMKTKPLPWLMQNIYPDLYSVHNLEEQQVILNMEEESVHVPPHLQLTSRFIDNIGAYLMDTGDHMMLYVCSGVSQVFLREGLGVPIFNSLNDQMYEIPVIENQTNQRLLSFINYLNEDKPYRATLQIIKDNSPSRGVFLERLIEDRVENALSYHEFLQHVKAQMK